jgi:hypothetical protein
MSDIIHKSAKYSLGAQIFTGIVDGLALQVDVDPKDFVLKQLLGLELVVQMIEAVFYIWLVKSFHKIDDITKFRYYDWVLSTSIMLYTLIIYLVYLQDENKEGKKKTLSQLQEENKGTIRIVLFLNLLMLMFGYLGEIRKLDTCASVNIGYLPFLTYFKIIYDKYVRTDVLDKKNVSIENKKQIQQLFWYFYIFWSMYGIAAYMPYKPKNVAYNVLDLFSKNFFGLFLSYQVYKRRKQ